MLWLWYDTFKFGLLVIHFARGLSLYAKLGKYEANND